MAVTAGQLVQRIAIEGVDEAKAQLSSFGAAVDSVGQKASGGLLGGIKSMASGFLDFGAKLGQSVIGFKGLADGAISLASSLLKPAASAEQVRGSLEVFTGSAAAAKQEMADLANFASHTPFETSAIDQAALKLQSVGISSKDVIPDLLSLGDALDAIGRTSSADLQQVTSNFVKIQTQGHLSTEVMQSFADMGIDAWGILEKQTGKTHDQLAKLISSGLYPAKQAMDDLTKGIENNPLFKGQMANDANVFNGALSTIKSNWEQLLANFGDPIIKGLEPLMANLANTMASQKFKDFATLIGQTIVTAFTDVGKLVVSLTSGLQSLGKFASVAFQPFADEPFGLFVGGIQDVLISLGKLGTTLGKIGSAFLKAFGPSALDPKPIANFFQTALDTAANFFHGLSLKIDQFTALLKKVDGSVYANKLKAEFGSFSTWLSATWFPKIQATFTKLDQTFAKLGTGINAKLAPLHTSLQQIGQMMLTALLPAPLRLLLVLPQLIDKFHQFAPALQPVVKVMQDLAKQGFDKFQQGLAWLLANLPTVTGNIQQFAGSLQNNLGQAWQSIQPAVNGFKTWLSTDVLKSLKDASSGFSNLGDAIGQHLVPALQGIAFDQMTTFMHVFDAFRPGLAKLIPLLIQLSGIFAGGLGDAIKAITPDLQAAVFAVDDFLKKVADRLGPKFTQAVDNMQKLLDGLKAHWDQIWLALGPVVEGFWNQCKGIVQIGWNLVSGIILIGLDILTGDWGQAWQDLVDMAKGIIDGFHTWILGTFQLMFGGLWNMLKQWLASMGIDLNKLPTIFQTAFTNANNNATATFGLLPGKITAILVNLIAQITAKLDSLKNLFMQKATDAANAFLAPINGLISGVQSILNKIGQIISSWTPPAINLPGIPAAPHAKGIMNSPVGHLGLVGEQGPEYMWIPKGASIFPHGFNFGAIMGEMLRPFSGGGSSMPAGANAIPPSMHISPTIIVNVAPPDVRLDGYKLTTAQMPYIVREIRAATGARL
jgi:tape measure domain-containing protein